MSEWISVKDRLPEKSSTFVLALTASGELSVGRNIIVADYIHPVNEPCGAFIQAYGDELDMLNITHWMPLPELPRSFQEVYSDDKA